MQSIEKRGLEKLNEDLEAILRESGEMRRALHGEFADMAQNEVHKSVAESLNDSHGHIRAWQKQYVGSGGGYAAVCAENGSAGAKSPGAITNYLENGHKIRPAGGETKRRRTRIRTAYVDGRFFYASAAPGVEAGALKIAEDFAGKLAEKLGG